MMQMIPYNPESGGSMFLQIVGYTSSHLRRQRSSLNYWYENVRPITGIPFHHRLCRKHFTSPLFCLQYRPTPAYKHNALFEMCLEVLCT
jgi:hypothetical protein